jgi:K+-sensing histidine kinase KdpD
MVTSMWATWQRDRRRELAFEPTERQPLGVVRTRVAYLAAIVVPLAAGALMIPLRDELDQSTALILVVPVLLVALAGGIGPGLLAAVSATVTFDVLLTRPYFGFAIHGDDDVVAAVTLLVVGAAVGTVASRLARIDTRAGARRRTIGQITSFVNAVATRAADDATIVSHAANAISDILGLASCEWHTGMAPTMAPTILPDGQLMAYLSDLSEDRAQLPDRTELPVATDAAELGRFVLHPTRDHDVSIEERRAAAAVAHLLGHELAGRLPQRASATTQRL